ncbi:hypothetical protein [Natrarchaeobaculum aegyptiacum]|uniref:DUF4190 domain-containing protein n=1 Tax=Natrarchaeobaculum aegyptiacum TaxID=745377 RepID=A0A2Z2HQ55_9EURY|nr:hypothetical protein [Natrarchaeobaculum aegyptiacum]ARS89250.1 hypothetical protein B1756_05490 [Natrarchaeobaculum aegyptiacum]
MASSATHRGAASSRERTYIVCGAVCAVCAVYYLPIVFGPVAMYFGGRLYRDDAEPTGVAIALLGLLGLILGFFNVIVPAAVG